MSIRGLATFVFEHLHAGVIDEPHFDELADRRKDHETDHESWLSIEPNIKSPANSQENGDGESHLHALAHALVDIARTIALGQSTREAA